MWSNAGTKYCCLFCQLIQNRVKNQSAIAGHPGFFVETEVVRKHERQRQQLSFVIQLNRTIEESEVNGFFKS